MGEATRAAAAAFALGVLLQFLGCSLWHNWWPLLTAFAYVMVPMPALFFSSTSAGGGLSPAWADTGHFLTGFAAVSTLAIPGILYHTGKIAFGALVMEILAVALMGGALLVFEWERARDGYGGGGFFAS